MIGNKYELKRNEKELLEIEKDLAKHLKVPFVKCSYDGVNSHKYEDKHELESRKKFAKETGFWDMCDFIINYEKYKTKKIMRQTMVATMEKYMSYFILKAMEITL